MSGWPSPTRDDEPSSSLSNPYYDLIDSPEIPKGELYGHDPRQSGQREIPPPRDHSYSRPVSPPIQARVVEQTDPKPRKSSTHYSTTREEIELTLAFFLSTLFLSLNVQVVRDGM